MAVEFPRHLGIADFGKIEVIHAKGWLARGLFAVDFVQVPVNHRSVIEVFEAQQIETVFQDPLGPADNRFRLRRHPLPQQCHQLRYRLWIKKEPPPAARGRRAQAGRPSVAHLGQQGIPALGRRLAGTVPDLRTLHGDHTPDSLLPTRHIDFGSTEAGTTLILQDLHRDLRAKLGPCPPTFNNFGNSRERRFPVRWCRELVCFSRDQQHNLRCGYAECA